MRRDITALVAALGAFAVSLALLGAPRLARCQTIGAHLGTAHASKDAKDDSPGLYAVLPAGVAGGRVLFGGYRNSLNTTPRRTSYYIGQTWQFGRVGLAAIVVSGYHKERKPIACPPDGPWFADCWRQVGFWHRKWMPIAVPSYALPAIEGITPRLSLVGVKKPALHLSIEGSFRGL